MQRRNPASRSDLRHGASEQGLDGAGDTVADTDALDLTHPAAIRVFGTAFASTAGLARATMPAGVTNAFNSPGVAASGARVQPQ
jgi:hypothetical protein